MSITLFYSLYGFSGYSSLRKSRWKSKPSSKPLPSSPAPPSSSCTKRCWAGHRVKGKLSALRFVDRRKPQASNSQDSSDDELLDAIDDVDDVDHEESEEE